MRENKIDAILCQNGASLYYFTGERGGSTTWVLLAKGEAASFDDADGFEHFLKAAHPNRVGIEERTPFSVFDSLRKKLPAAEFVSADPVTIGCRVIKSPAKSRCCNAPTISPSRATKPRFNLRDHARRSRSDFAIPL